MIVARLGQVARRHPMLYAALGPLIALRRRWLRREDDSTESILDRLAGLFAEDPVLQVDEFEGRFAFSSRSRLFRRVVEQGAYEPALTKCLLEHLDIGRDAIDVGANIGFHTVLFARRLEHRRVLAIEPTPDAGKRLLRNIALNDVGSRVVVFDGAASDVVGHTEIKSIAGLEEFSSLGAMAHPSISGKAFAVHRIETRTLDQLVAEHSLDPGLLKVDVEGFEHHVFKGALETLARHRPVVVSELSDYLLRRNGSSAQEVVRLFESIGYRVLDPLHPAEKPGAREFGDMLCLPMEHIAAP